MAASGGRDLPPLPRGRAETAALRDELERDLCAARLAHFVRRGWPILEPATPYVHGDVVDAVCEHLEAVIDGEITRLLITIPPGMMKSLLTAVFLPAWAWGPRGKPHLRFLGFSYSDRLSVRDARRTKLLVESSWYRRLWNVRLSLDQNAKTKFETKQRGWRMASSVGGVGTGERGDVLICLPSAAVLRTDSGPLPIGAIVDARLAVRVLGFDHAEGTPVWGRIERHERSPGRPLVRVATAAGRVLLCTDDHPVFADGGYVPAVRLRRGARLRALRPPPEDARHPAAADGVVEDVVVGVERVADIPGAVYNVRVSPTANYFADGLLVHNCDDPHAIGDADSPSKLESTLLWWRETLPTRLNDPARSAIIVIGQRVAENDVAGDIIAREQGWTVLKLPMEFEPADRCVTLGGKFADWRTEPGQLLFPERFSAETVAALKADIGSFATASQLQQAPAPRGGAMIRVDRLAVVDAAPPGLRLCRAWDLAGTEPRPGADPDYTAGALLGYRDGVTWILHVEHERLSPLGVEQRVAAVAHRDRALHGEVAYLLKQDPGSAGKAVASRYLTEVLAGFEAHAQRETGSKVERARNFAAAAEAGNVCLVRGPWNDAFVAEARVFPRGRHDDQVDAACSAREWLASESVFWIG